MLLLHILFVEDKFSLKMYGVAGLKIEDDIIQSRIIHMESYFHIY